MNKKNKIATTPLSSGDDGKKFPAAFRNNPVCGTVPIRIKAKNTRKYPIDIFSPLFSAGLIRRPSIPLTSSFPLGFTYMGITYSVISVTVKAISKVVGTMKK